MRGSRPSPRFSFRQHRQICPWQEHAWSKGPCPQPHWHAAHRRAQLAQGGGMGSVRNEVACTRPTSALATSCTAARRNCTAGSNANDNAARSGPCTTPPVGAAPTRAAHLRGHSPARCGRYVDASGLRISASKSFTSRSRVNSASMHAAVSGAPSAAWRRSSVSRSSITSWHSRRSRSACSTSCRLSMQPCGNARAYGPGARAAA